MTSDGPPMVEAWEINLLPFETFSLFHFHLFLHERVLEEFVLLKTTTTLTATTQKQQQLSWVVSHSNLNYFTITKPFFHFPNKKGKVFIETPLRIFKQTIERDIFGSWLIKSLLKTFTYSRPIVLRKNNDMIKLNSKGHLISS